MKKLLLLLFLVGTAHADPLAVEEIQTPLGGLNTADPTWRISSKYSPYMRNVFIDQGRIEGINGYQTVGTTLTLSKVTGIFPFRRENGNTTFLVTDSSVTLETSDFQTWVLVSSNSNTGSPLNWIQVRNKMWGYNGLDFVKTWDGINRSILNGNDNTPNVPKFKYAQYWQERVWGFNNPSLASELAFSSVVTTDAVIIDPTDSRAWPVTNSLKIGQGDGEIGTALWVRNGQLKAGKERSKYTIYGTNVSNYFARKDISNSVGVISNDSVVNLDDSTYYLSYDGIYKDEQRISDLIEDDIENISRGVQKNVQNIWDTQSDFTKGQLFGTTATASGFLKPLSKGKFFNNVRKFQGGASQPFSAVLSSVYPSTPSTSITNDASTYIRIAVTPPDYIPTDDVFAPGDKMFISDLALPCNGTAINMSIKNFYTGEEAIIDLESVKPYEAKILFDHFVVDGGSLGFRWALKNIGDVISCGRAASLQEDLGNWFFKPTTTGSFISEITTVSSNITSWSSLDSLNSTNGGEISYFYRTSTSAVNIATQTWNAIGPGAIINAPIINNYIQWTTTITSVSSMTQSVSNIDYLTINHVEGAGSFSRAFGIDWKNRYWLATSTDGGNIFSLIYVKSKVTNENPNAFMPIEGINIRSFAKDGNVLYGGSSSTGSVYRLDYGTNFDGAAIPFIYETPDMILGSNFTSKNIQSYLLDADKGSALTLNVGSSIDFGSFSNKSIPLIGSGRSLNSIKGVTAPAKTLRIRLSHSLLDQPFVINNLSVLYSPTAILEPK